MSLKGTFALLVLVLLGSGCAHYPINAPRAAMDARTSYRFDNTAFSTNSDDLLLMLAFSGGAPVPPLWIMAYWKHWLAPEWDLQ